MSTDQTQPPAADKDDSAIVRAINTGTEATTAGTKATTAGTEATVAGTKATVAGAKDTVAAIENQADSLGVRSLRNVLACVRTLGVSYIAAATIPFALGVASVAAPRATFLGISYPGAGFLFATGVIMVAACSHDLNRRKA